MIGSAYILYIKVKREMVQLQAFITSKLYGSDVVSFTFRYFVLTEKPAGNNAWVRQDYKTEKNVL